MTSSAGQTVEFPQAAQTEEETFAFVEAFAKVTVRHIRDNLGSPLREVDELEAEFTPDWDDTHRLSLSGLTHVAIDAAARAGRKYLHIDVAQRADSLKIRRLFLGFTGFSDKQQRELFPILRSPQVSDLPGLSLEVKRLNNWLDEIRADGFDPSAFITYQRGIGIHGATQNLSGSIGAAGAVIAFVDAIREVAPDAIVDVVGELAPPTVRTPAQVYGWLRSGKNHTVRALLLANRRALVFASSKDANIFEPLGGTAFSSAADALAKFNVVARNQRERAQRLHEHAVGEVKTATDPNNLHERMGLASRETQTELRTDRFLMMAILNRDILAGGTQRRVMNNRDLKRFSHVFNLHHCWGWDGGRERNPEHWAYFRESVRLWCGL